MAKGWVKFYRALLEHGIWKNPNLWRVASYCILKASHAEHQQMVGYQPVTIKPGQLIFGRKEAAKQTGLSEMQVRTSLKHLEKTFYFLTIKATKRFSIITICNWDTYQGVEVSNNQKPNQQVTNEQPTGNQQVTTNKNVKNVKNVKNNTPKRDDTDESNFEKFKSRIGKLFKRVKTTGWSAKEIKALKNILKRPDAESELAEIEILYNSQFEYKRKAVETFLNNWTIELDRSRDSKNLIPPQPHGFTPPPQIARANR